MHLVNDVLSWALDIATGLRHLKNQPKPLVHCDLAARNVLLKADNTAVVAGFEDEKKGAIFKIHKRVPVDQAPECHKYKVFSPKSDVFSWALTVFEIATACRKSDDSPTNETDEQYSERIYNNLEASFKAGWKEIFGAGRMPKDLKLPAALLDLMKQCLSFDADKRPSADQIVAVLEVCSFAACVADRC